MKFQNTSRNAVMEAPATSNDASDTLYSAAEIWKPSPCMFTFSKGRVALFAILKAIGVGEDDEVLVPGFTCVVVPAAICYTGATPVYYDIDLETYNGSEEEALALLSSRTRAVIVQHTYGMPMEFPVLLCECRKREIFVIEDCAHAMGGMSNGAPLGTLGDAAFASFQWSKPVSTGLGGIARINNVSIRDDMARVYDNEFCEPSRMRSLTTSLLSWGYRKYFTTGLYWSARTWYHKLSRLGLVQGSSSNQELVGSCGMPHEYSERFGKLRQREVTNAVAMLPKSVSHRNNIASAYIDWCRVRRIKIQRQPEKSLPVFLRFPLLVSNRSKILAAAYKNRVELGDWFNAPLHPDGANLEAVGYSPGVCPNAEWASSRVINLPTHQGVSIRESKRILCFMDQHADSLITE